MNNFNDARFLEWDSEFFGFGVAQITPESVDLVKLNKLLSDLKLHGIDLVYWAAGMDLESKKAALANSGLHVDRKTTFVMSSKDIDHGDTMRFNDGIVITEWPQQMNKELESLAVQCGYYSRFNVDPFMPAGLGDKLYIEWIKNSVYRKIADMVIVALNQHSKVVGMVTLGDKNGKGDIGLVAVDSSARGKMVGKRLIHAAQKWFIKQDYTDLQVVTQGNNVPASRLYQSCNYRIGEVKDFYHFWLNKE